MFKALKDIKGVISFRVVTQTELNLYVPFILPALRLELQLGRKTWGERKIWFSVTFPPQETKARTFTFPQRSV